MRWSQAGAWAPCWQEVGGRLRGLHGLSVPARHGFPALPRAVGSKKRNRAIYAKAAFSSRRLGTPSALRGKHAALLGHAVAHPAAVPSVFLCPTSTWVLSPGGRRSLQPCIGLSSYLPDVSYFSHLDLQFPRPPVPKGLGKGKDLTGSSWPALRT